MVRPRAKAVSEVVREPQGSRGPRGLSRGWGMLSQETLKAHLRYDPDTGYWWRLGTWRKWRLGRRADTRVGSAGYRAVRIFKKQYLAHRLAWFYMTGKWPIRLDHKNLNKEDNSWNNLRECNQSQNGANSKLNKNNTSGHRGVSFDRGKRRTKCWKAQIKVRYRYKYLGRYCTKHEAISAYRQAAKIIFGEYARYD